MAPVPVPVPVLVPIPIPILYQLSSGSLFLHRVNTGTVPPLFKSPNKSSVRPSSSSLLPPCWHHTTMYILCTNEYKDNNNNLLLFLLISPFIHNDDEGYSNENIERYNNFLNFGWHSYLLLIFLKTSDEKKKHGFKTKCIAVRETTTIIHISYIILSYDCNSNLLSNNQPSYYISRYSQA